MTRLRKSRPRRVAGLVLGAVAVVGAVALWPVNLGGDTTYVTTYGNSMQPRLHAGDLVIARPEADYAVGDVVAYRSSALDGTVVLHRIAAQGPEGLTTKGDNNDWLDPDRPQPSEILGELWLHIPGGGRVLAAFTNPYVIAAVVVALLSLGSVTAARRSSRRGSRRATRAAIDRPRLLPTDLPAREWAAVTALIAVALAVLAFGRPATASVSDKIDLTHTAELSYSAVVKTPGIYTGNRVRTGDPVFLTAAPVLDTQLDYRLGSGAADVTGTIGSRAELSAGNGWRRSIPLGTPQAFTGSHVERTLRLDLARLLQIGRTAEKAAGTTFGAYTVQVVHEIHLKGTVDDQPIVTTYKPKLTLTLDNVQAVLQGTTAGTAGEAVRTTEQSNVAVPASAPATITVLRWDMPVTLLRIVSVVLGLVAAALAALAIARRGEHRRARATFGSRLVRAANVDLGDRPVVDIHDAQTLARLAKLHDTIVLHVIRPDGELFLVTVDDTIYRYAEPQPNHDDRALTSITD